MADRDAPQIYLVTPPAFELTEFVPLLARVLDGVEVACLRLALATRDEDRLSRAADALRDLAHARDVPLVIAEHVALATRLGLDGVHLTDGARSVRSARTALGADAIIGAFARASRHDGMSAGEAGADYVSFGPVAPSTLGDGSHAPRDLFEWWSEMIEVPVVAEGLTTGADVADLAPVADFLTFSETVWDAPDPAAALTLLARAAGR
jgi:thiamine-phosphate pyrophosphorylase